MNKDLSDSKASFTIAKFEPLLYSIHLEYIVVNSILYLARAKLLLFTPNAELNVHIIAKNILMGWYSLILSQENAA